MIFIIRISFFLSIICLSVGLGGAYQGYTHGKLVPLLAVAGVLSLLLAFLFSLVISVVKPPTNPRSKEFEMPITGVISIVLGLGLFAIMGYGYTLYGDKPLIKDISTNTDLPPKFRGPVKTISALEGLEFLSNSSVSRGYNLADGMEQISAYPEVQPQVYKESQEIIYKAALVSAKTSPGWQVLFEDANSFHFEAVAESDLFHFKDDVAVEVRLNKKSESVLQVRSRSRVGIFDLGANAKRIVAFQAKVKSKVPQIAKRMAAAGAATTNAVEVAIPETKPLNADAAASGTPVNGLAPSSATNKPPAANNIPASTPKK